MIYEKNLNKLKDKFPAVYNALLNLSSKYKLSEMQVSMAKDGNPTLAVEVNGNMMQLLSKYNPVVEAEQFVASIESTSDYRHVVFFGCGLGYHIEMFNKKHPDLSYTILEPFPDLFHEYIKCRLLDQLSFSKLKDIFLLYEEADISNYLRYIVDTYHGGSVLVIHPAYSRLFPEITQQVNKQYKESFSNKIQSIQINATYEKRWVVNSLINFPTILQTPDIMIDTKETFNDKPVVLVAAGPSLEEELDNLRYIKENKLAYIFSVGTAINGLLAYGIYPDAACTYDPSPLNLKVFEKVIEQDIKSIPLIYGSSVAHEVVNQYPGPKLHMLTSQDTISSFLIKSITGEPVNLVNDAASISIITTQLLQTLNCSLIVLVGQNFAYKNNQIYSKSSLVIEDSVDVGNALETAISVPSVTGGEVYTNKDWSQMRIQMESLISRRPDLKVINTTNGGARISHTTYCSLKDVIETELKVPVVQADWYTKRHDSYDLDNVKFKINKMSYSYKVLLKELDEVVENLRKIDKAINKYDQQKLANVMPKLDAAMNKVSKNDFFNSIILPMNRVKYDFFLKKVAQIRGENNILVKGKIILKEFGDFVYVIQHDALLLQDTYKVTSEAVLDIVG
ncbi:motility associated factor glycosyltransferase family protein [Paenibacillus qinlingensis]|uniref:motility associated factor glycosyltransferase family protein n=1 Tax=Paenibacillus qinlingensis TaxID=1837343 RepID=UPI00156759A3|nr:6-hydroxymethylpterin diphosphokinase MptE-like protein [Paenibacillus qinlingensis]NQX61924.1 motility associated factor glycosyltransferase family protein [Paenibacillus qinlingensis]